MKREAFHHPKMIRLADELGTSLSHAVGLFGFLLNWAADYAPQGNIGKHTDGVLARACHWEGDPAAFVRALIDARLVDECDIQRLVIHDLEDHAERWWHLKLQKMRLQFIKATKSQSIEATTEQAVERTAESTVEPSILLSSSLQTSSLLSSDKESSQARVPAKEPEPEKPAPRQRAKTQPPIEAVKFPTELDSPPVRLSLGEWLEYKTRRKEFYASPLEIEKLLKRFARAGPEAFIAEVDRAISNTWQGIQDHDPRRSGTAKGNRPAPKDAGQRFIEGAELGSF